MKEIYVYSFRRSGTNMFASYLELHPNISSFNTGGSQKLKLTKGIDTAVPIFEGGVGYVKGRIKYNLFDEVHPSQYNKDKIGIAFIRNYDSINNSIKKMYKKLHGIYIPLFRKSPYITKSEYNKLLKIAKREDILAISMELFVKNPLQYLNALSNYLNLSPFPKKEDVFNQGCNCGSKFTIINTDNLPNDAKKLISKQDFLYCKKHKSTLNAAGGFNPFSEMDLNRVEKFNHFSFNSFNDTFNNDFFFKK